MDLKETLGNALKALGIVTEGLEAHEKSTLQLEKSLNDTFDPKSSFSETLGCTLLEEPHSNWSGIENLGNTCYMSCILQAFFCLPSVHNYLSVEYPKHIKECRRGAQCLFCNIGKLGLKLVDDPTNQIIKLIMFRWLMRSFIQYSFDTLNLFLELVSRQNNAKI